ncbi:MAG TPA: hypothetical protein VER36_09870 [Flavisolibacter sp.]|nr:hypothetical protein [Flavisolibacter sp.]
MRPPLLLLLLALQSSCSHAQSADSLSRSVDSQSKAIQALDDSIYRLKMQRTIDQNSQTIDQFLASYKEGQAKERRQTYIRIGAMIILLAALIYGFVRKRSKLEKPD